MLFRAHLLPGLADGSVTCAFRRWRRATVKAGGTLRTAAGVLAIDAVDVVRVGEVTEGEARAAGYPDRDALLADLGLSGPSGDEHAHAHAHAHDEVHRIRFHHAGADPRAALRERADLSAGELEELRARLGAIDARSHRGAWTRATLDAIAAHPGERAAELAAALGRGDDVPRFKTDVRKLKELGLTESLRTGYRLSPRGEALLAALDSDG